MPRFWKPRQRAAHVLVLERQQVGQQLDERYLRTERRKHRGPLGADGATADDHDAFGHLSEQEGAVGVDDAGQLPAGYG